jgi:(R,R)-butanediol dehydrogenase / meso-butanediol dehydrogenase / diacetyl reductase
VRALRFHGAGDLRVEDVPAPVVGDGEVEVAVVWCGICASDVHEYRDGPHVVPRPDRPHPLTGEHLPVTLGHEISGRVAGVGRGVTGLAEGTPVVVNPLRHCGSCTECVRGLRHLCRRSAVLGLSGGGGGLAERVVVARDLVFVLPPAVGPAEGALVEPLSVAWHAVRRAGAAPTTALVVGAGPIGLALVLVLRALGVSEVLVAARRTGRRAELAESFGARTLVGGDPAGSVRRHTDGEGVDAVFEAAGTDEALALALRAVRRRGVVVNVALRGGRATLDLDRALGHEITVVGSTGYLDDHPEVLRHLAAGAFTGVDRLITGRVPLEHAVADGFEPLLRRRGEHVKILVSP